MALVLATLSANGQTNSAPVPKQGKAIVRSVRGVVDYFDSGVWLTLKNNMKFDPGVTFRTGPDGVVDISINGLSSVVRLTNSTTLQVNTMEYTGNPRDGDIKTVMTLKNGAILGNIKKISANSSYQVDTPNGMMAVRGTDFMIAVAPSSDGESQVTKFSSITGMITVSAMVDGKTVVHTLTTGTFWEVGGQINRVGLIKN